MRLRALVVTLVVALAALAGPIASALADGGAPGHG
jgi:hypothetical protein